MLTELPGREVGERLARPDLETLLQAATLAPSGDNTQPWRFGVDGERGTITFYLDETRDRSPMNSGQRMARIAVGAALENALRTAQHNGWQTTLKSAAPPALAALCLHGSGSGAGEIDDVLRARVTNRRMYDGGPVAPKSLERMRAETPDLEGVKTHWIVRKDRIVSFAALIGRADALMLGDPSMRRAFLEKVRFDQPAGAAVAEGLAVASLELSFADRWMLRALPRLPNWLLRLAGAKRSFAANARKLAQSASGLCLIAASAEHEAADVTVGRAMQRAWLALTAEGLAVQPMMSLLVLENVGDHGSPEIIAALGKDGLHSLRSDLRSRVPEMGAARPAFLLRFGFASPPSGRTGRLPIASVTALRPDEGMKP